jgi:uncharacterized protein (TIGR02145 family)
MKKTFLSIAFCFMVFILSAQDLIYTVSGELNTQKTSLDSILVENLTNQTRILFGKLPALDYYQINLSKNAFWGSVGVNVINSLPLFTEQRNLPGNLAVTYNGNEPIEVDLLVYNVAGMLVYSPVKKRLYPGNLVNIRIGAAGVYFARIKCMTLSQTFKTIGLGVAEDYGVTVSDQKYSGLKLKNVQISDNDHFSFTPGDSIRVSVYKNGYYARPKGMKIAGGTAVNFLFEQSAVAIDGTSDAFVPLDLNTTNISSFDTITGIVKIQYTGNMPQLNPGDIIPVNLETSGDIRKVVKTSDSNGHLTVETVQAYLSDVFVDKEIKLHTGLMNPGVQLKSASTNEEISKALTDKDGYIHPVEIFYTDNNGKIITKSVLINNTTADVTIPIINFNKNIATDLYGKEGDNVHFFIDEGYVSLTSDVVFEFDFKYKGDLIEDTKIKKGDLNTFKFYLDSKAEFLAKLALDMNKSYEKEDEKKIIDLEKVTAKFMVGAVPVWITFDCDIYGNYKFSADASAHMDWGFETKQTLQVGGTYDRKTDTFTPASTYTPENKIYPLNAKGAVNASARMEIYPRVDVKFYDFFGPYAEIVPYVQGNYNAVLETQIMQNGAENFLGWNSGVDIGLDFRTGTELTFLWGLFDKKFGPKTINCYEKPLWQSPTKIELITSLPTDAEGGKLIPLTFKVSDLLGNPVPLCPVYIKGAGIFSKQILFTNIDGEATVDWTVGTTTGNNSFTATIYKADKNVIEELTKTIKVNGGTGGTGTLVYEGRTYKTVIINGKEWMAENLAYLPAVYQPTSGSSTEPRYYVYNYNGSDVDKAKQQANYNTYGVLYNWPAAKIACPSGWHLPSYEEWEQLAEFVSNQKGPYSNLGDVWNDVGKHLKATSGWKDNGNGTDDFGFTALPSGFRHNTWTFFNIKAGCDFWSSEESSNGSARRRYLNYQDDEFKRDFVAKEYGYSVRCVKD